MKAATYNIWDSQAGMPERYEQIIGEIRQTDAGIICLQEAGGEKMLRKLAEDCGYPHLHWNPNAGTAMMSRYCFEEKHEFDGLIPRLQSCGDSCAIYPKELS